jgi:small nuclear ribonucleoprotein (snRNP)-like protein
MRPKLLAATTMAALMIAASAALAADTTQPAANVPVKEVVLFSSGVGYFEHFGTVQGDGSTELRFKTNQINDILKSLVLQDLDGGKVTTITYPSQDPIAKTLKSFQVDITANPPLADLLNQLRGAKVTLVTGNGEKMTGTVLGVETHKKVVGDHNETTIDQPFLNLLSSGKIASEDMSSLSSIQLEDPQLQDELNKALLALAGARDQDKKPVKINFTGQGERHVRIGYVVETPIWKSSYRLILGAPKAGNPAATTQPGLSDGNIQGWAIVENQTDNDWNNVQLSLVSGRPISFIEDLYQPMYIPRPVVKPELYASLRPQTYAAGTEATAGEVDRFAGGAGGGRDELGNRSLQAQQMAKAARAQQNLFQSAAAMPAAPPAEEPMNPTASVSSLASASSVGELFEYTVGNVTLPRQRSAMIPIITDPVEVERVSIYNRGVLPRNPLNGARVKNTTQKHLLAGPITVIDGATYAGDAQIDNLPPGQERLLSYGVDLQMLVDAKDASGDSQLMTGKIVKGILTLTRKNVRSQDYLAENKSDHDKSLIIEHPRDAAWELYDTPKPIETTDNVYRFKDKLAAGHKSKLTVKEQIVQSEEIAILPADVGQIEVYQKAGEIPKPVKDALAKAMTMKQAMVDTQRQIDQAKAKLTDITAEQNRIRENMRTVDKASQYYTRLMTKLNDQETQIEKTQNDIDALQKTLDGQRKELEAYLQDLNVG